MLDDLLKLRQGRGLKSETCRTLFEKEDVISKHLETSTANKPFAVQQPVHGCAAIPLQISYSTEI